MDVEYNMGAWREIILLWYPDYESKAYFVPPVVIKRMPFEIVPVSGQPVIVPQCLSSPIPSNPSNAGKVPSPQANSHTSPGPNTQMSLTTKSTIRTMATSASTVINSQPLITSNSLGPSPVTRNNAPQCTTHTAPSASGKMWINPPEQFVQVQESQTREDHSLQLVLLGLRDLAEEQNEVMFVISQLQFSHYLGKPVYAAAVKHFQRPVNLGAQYAQGDFDLLVIHRYYGILTGELKSVHSNQKQLNKSQEDIDKDLLTKVQHAIRQLNKSETVLRELTKDLEDRLAIRKTLVLPFVSRTDLQRVLLNNEKLHQDLVQSLDAADIDQALDFCLLSNNMPDSGSQSHIGQLKVWWAARVAAVKDTYMTHRLYLDLLARFCGPATTVTVYSVSPPRLEARLTGHGVSAVGERMAMLVLTGEQLHLLTRSPPRVMLTGGPGVGKSVTLALMAISWLRQGRHVFVVSDKDGSLAASHVLRHTIHETVHADPNKSPSAGQVFLHQYDFWTKEDHVDKAICALTKDVESQGLYVIFDEFWGHDNNIARYHRFVSELCERHPNVYLWVASIFMHHIPQQLQEEKMTTPLRYPTTVLSEVKKAFHIFNDVVYPYSLPGGASSPCDGLPVIYLTHEGVRHEELWPVECEECGKCVAELLQQLGVGHNPDPSDNKHRSIKTNIANKQKAICPPPPLQYRDVFVLIRSYPLRDDETDDVGRVTSRANGIVRGLRAAGIRVRVVTKERVSENICDTALAKSDSVSVADAGYMSGLERKIVVLLPFRRQGVDDAVSDDYLEARARLYAMSRCSSQLVVVRMPETVTEVMS